MFEKERKVSNKNAHTQKHEIISSASIFKLYMTDMAMFSCGLY